MSINLKHPSSKTSTVLTPKQLSLYFFISSSVLFYISTLIYIFLCTCWLSSFPAKRHFSCCRWAYPECSLSLILLWTSHPHPGYGSGSTRHLFRLIAGFPDHWYSTGVHSAWLSSPAWLHVEYISWHTLFFPSLHIIPSFFPFLSSSL